MAATLKKRVLGWDTFLVLRIGLLVSMSVLIVSWQVMFAFRLLPPPTALLFSWNMQRCALPASGLGGVTALTGFCLAYRWDLPVGATDVALLSVLYGVAFTAKKFMGLIRRPSVESASR